MALIAVLVVVIPLLLRIVVSRSGRTSITPAVAIVVAALFLLAFYFAPEQGIFGRGEPPLVEAPP